MTGRMGGVNWQGQLGRPYYYALVYDDVDAMVVVVCDRSCGHVRYEVDRGQDVRLQCWSTTYV